MPVSLCQKFFGDARVVRSGNYTWLCIFLNLTAKLPLLIGEKEIIYGARILFVAHWGNF